MKHIWYILEGAVQFSVAFYVFSKLGARFEFIVVSLIIMIYAALRSFFLQLELVAATRFSLLCAVLYAIRKRLGENVIDGKNVDDEITKFEKTAFGHIKDFEPHKIGLISHGILSLLCLYHLLIA